MKLLFLNRSLDLGGSERQLVILARELSRRGHVVSVATLYGGGLLELELREAVVPLVSLSKSSRWDIFSFPVRLLRDRRASFVELNAYDNFGKTSYGTAGYLGNGYFITVKHGVVALDEPGESREVRRITDIRVRYKGRDLSAHIVDAGDANVEVHPGDWAVIKVNAAVNLPPLRYPVRPRHSGGNRTALS